MAVAIRQPVTLIVTEACSTSEPLVPVIVKEYVPCPTDRATVKVTVVRAVPPCESVTGFWVNEAVIPPGILLVARFTGSLNTPTDCTVTVAVPEDA